MMDRIHIFVPRQLRDQIRALAAKNGVPVGELIRNALAQYIKNASPDAP
jgi:predicted DNA binding CopG/RHH family protein